MKRSAANKKEIQKLQKKETLPCNSPVEHLQVRNKTEQNVSWRILQGQHAKS
jgi:hypothetical protein